MCKNYLCFYSEIFGIQKTLRIPLEEIYDIDKREEKRGNPGILITTLNGEEVFLFSSFDNLFQFYLESFPKHRDQVYEMLKSCWKNLLQVEDLPEGSSGQESIRRRTIPSHRTEVLRRRREPRNPMTNFLTVKVSREGNQLEMLNNFSQDESLMDQSNLALDQIIDWLYKNRAVVLFVMLGLCILFLVYRNFILATQLTELEKFLDIMRKQ